jgi:hypothetical protein
MGQAASRPNIAENDPSTTEASQRAEDAIRCLIALRNVLPHPAPRDPDAPMQDVQRHNNDIELKDVEQPAAQPSEEPPVVRKAVPREVSIDMSTLALRLQKQGTIRLNAAEEKVVEAAYFLKVLAARRAAKVVAEMVETNAEKVVEKQFEKKVEKKVEKKPGKRLVRASAAKSIRKDCTKPVRLPVCEPVAKPVNKRLTALKQAEHRKPVAEHTLKPVHKPVTVPTPASVIMPVSDPIPASVLKPVRRIINRRHRDKKAGLQALIAGRTKKAEMALEACARSLSLQ